MPPTAGVGGGGNSHIVSYGGYGNLYRVLKSFSKDHKMIKDQLITPNLT